MNIEDAKKALEDFEQAIAKDWHKEGTKADRDGMTFDYLLAATTFVAMSRKLTISRLKGRDGWWADAVSNAQLKQMLLEHIEKGGMLDVCNLAAMIYFRQITGIEK